MQYYAIEKNYNSFQRERTDIPTTAKKSFVINIRFLEAL